VRRPTDLAAQVALLERYFRSALTADAAAGLASRPHPGGRGGPRPRDARFVPVVAALVSAFPPHVIQYARAALLTLPPPQGYAVYLLCSLELAPQTVARHLDRSVRSVHRYRRDGLDQLARWLWDDAYQPTVPAPLRQEGREPDRQPEREEVHRTVAAEQLEQHLHGEAHGRPDEE